MKKLDNIQIKLLVNLHNYIYNRISWLSVNLNKGIHPKHRIMDFHKFFVENLKMIQQF